MLSEEKKHIITKQDAVILNIERACRATIDMGTRIVRKKSLASRKAIDQHFRYLKKDNLISLELS
ncbi:hypothetical protein DDZ16_17465 [Marinilabilia rubra]|uniref:Uncharacterized protein n=1 Tax=Marinilabilia rubra TaxID=2162893 RepID=A0A2U2B4Y9_9BACT|nr:hypothetical protein DDZ16_17465 [Marinilabilia rubra]